MLRFTLLLLVFALTLTQTYTAQAAPVSEQWWAAYFGEIRAGSYQVVVQTVPGPDGKPIYRSERNMRVAFRRYDTVSSVHITLDSDESAEGKVLGLSLTEYKGKEGKSETFKGTVREGKITLQMPGGKVLAKGLPFDPMVIGQYRQEQLYKERKAKPGDRFSFQHYELLLMQSVRMNVHVARFEEVDLLEVTPAKTPKAKPSVRRVPQKLLRVEISAEPIDVGGRKLQIPGTVVWLDSDYRSAREELEFPGLGTLTFFRVPREFAESAALAPERLPDLGYNSMVAVTRIIDKPNATQQLRYHVKLKGDPQSVFTAFAQDERQQVRKLPDGGCEVLVTAQRIPNTKAGKLTEPGKEYLQSNYYLNTDQPALQKQSQAIVGVEKDPWKKALLIEKWVRRALEVDYTIDFCTASEVLQGKKGDCRQHAILCAALCRASGVPARTAFGLVYAREPKRGPVLVFHMWTEVWVQGGWLGLDATLAEGGIGACHLKIADQSWAGVRNASLPLIPVMGVVGKLSVEIAEVR